MISAEQVLAPARPTAIGLVAAAGTAAIIGLPTDVIPNPVFSRQTPVHPYDVAVLLALALLTGALVATYALAGDTASGTKRTGIGSGVLGFFAIGCPACNKLIVLLLGASGATSTFAPLQPALGAVAVALAAGALTVRIRALRRAACPTPRA